MKAVRNPVGILIATVAIGACSDHLGIAAPEIEAATGTVPAMIETQGDRRPGERVFRELSRQFPAFAGFYFDEERQLVVQVTDPGQGAALRPAVISFLRELAAERGSPGGPLPRIVFRVADYSYAQLDAWRALLEGSLFQLQSVVMLDLDEERNRLTIGLSNERGRSEVEALARQLAVPQAALHVMVVGEAIPLVLRTSTAIATSTSGCTDVRGECRPLIGGFQVSFFRSGEGKSCTLGFPVLFNGGETGFVTNSHCSQDKWNLEFTAFYQPDTRYPSIGSEAIDPRGWSCDVFFKCRHSDANIVRTSTETDVGYIARLAQISNGTWVHDPASFIVDPERPRFRIRATSGVVGGDLVFSVGRTTGWRHGRVQHTCATYNQLWSDGTWHKTLCSDASDAWADHGDSGGPVFLWDGVSDAVTLVGVLFARTSNYNTFFSPITGIQRDLGGFEARAPEFRTPPPPPQFDVNIFGPQLVRPYAQCLFTASAYGGVEPYSYAWTVNDTPVGSDPAIYYASGASNFEIAVTVTDGQNRTAWRSLYVSVDGSAPECLDM